MSDLSFFNTQFITEKREVILYPNNLLLGKPAIVNPRDRLDGVGKLPAAVKPGAVDTAEAPGEVTRQPPGGAPS